MYGLKQGSVLTCKKLTKLLTDGGYEHILGLLEMWKHKKRKTICVSALMTLE